MFVVPWMLAALLAVPAIATAETVEELRRELDAMRRKVEALEEKLERIEATSPRGTGAAERSPAASSPLDRALDAAREEAAAAPPPAPVPTAPGAVARPSVPPGALLSGRVGGADLRLIDVSFDILTAAGWSTADDHEIGELEAGAHDPKRRGFTLQQGELSFMGAVDPYFTAESHVVFTDEEIELEEAFARTTALPWGLEARAGYFFTHFGRINWQHPHAWDWLDQPVILSRLFGAEGLRSPGLDVSWLVPVPWYAELRLGAQNATGDTAVSFLGDGEAEEGAGSADAPIGGRIPVGRSVHDLDDLLYLTRLQTAFTLTESVTAAIGGSALFGPNATGPDQRTTIYGGDVVVKWRPAKNFRGWPFVAWQTEAMQRAFEAPVGGDLRLAPTLFDWGLYSQLLWGFRYGWAAGFRYEYADGTGQSRGRGGLDADPFRGPRPRLTPLLVWHPSEFSRLRLQYDFDQAAFLPERDASSVWLGIEVTFGAHPAHQY
jgi:hypothetical protein